MSGYASKQEVVSVIKASIKADSAQSGLSRDPKDYYVSRIVSDVATCNYFGWSINIDPEVFVRALRTHMRKS